MARGAGELIEEVAQSKLTGEEDRYSEADLWSIEANVAGSKKIVDILRPTLETVDAAWLERADAAFADVDEVIAKYRDGDGFTVVLGRSRKTTSRHSRRAWPASPRCSPSCRASSASRRESR